MNFGKEEQEILHIISIIKSMCLQSQLYEAASEMRDIQNSFRGEHNKEFVKPTIENLDSMIFEAVGRLKKKCKKNAIFLSTILRDIRLIITTNE